MPGYYEVHCHILPGVDDGAKSMKETRRTAMIDTAQIFFDFVNCFFTSVRSIRKFQIKKLMLIKIQNTNLIRLK